MKENEKAKNVCQGCHNTANLIGPKLGLYLLLYIVTFSW